MTNPAIDQPRTDAGKFDEKPQSGPELALAPASVPQSWSRPSQLVPEALRSARDTVAAAREAAAQADSAYQDAVGAAFTAFIEDRFPTASHVTFVCRDDEPTRAPEITGVYADEVPLWTYDQAGFDDFNLSAQPYANEITSPYNEGSLLEQVDYDDFYGGGFVFNIERDGA